MTGLADWIHVLLVLVASALAMAAGFVFALRRDNIGYVDAFWAALTAAAAVYAGIAGDGAALPRALVAAMGGLWGLRLFRHLVVRVAGETEDGRYRALRAAWHDSRPKLFAFFQAQAVVVALFFVPFLAAASNPEGAFTVWTAGAIAVWLVAVGGETLADRQLAAFRKAARGRKRTCRRGLWSWSRHPNYFFEWLHWFAYVLLAVGGDGLWFALAGPVVMFLFLHRVSGIPWTEQQALRSRGDDYRRYQREVSAFFPWPPRRPPFNSAAE